jgi:tetratricopeptide (TPR) repeat protein
VRLRLGLGAVLVLLVLAVFAQVRRFDFLRIDDQTYVSKNPDIASGLTARSVAWAFTTGRAANWHPLTWISHMIDVELFGMWAGGHHLTSVAIHAATTVLVFSFLLGIVSNPWTAASLAALWAVHPLRCESVAWVAERKDVLSGLFWMATVLAYTRYAIDPRRRRAYAAALACFALGLLAKPMLVTLPIVMMLLDRWPLGRPVTRALVLEKVPFFGLAFASAVVTLLVQQRGGAVAQLEQVPASLRLANAVVAIPEYLFRTIWPLRLAAFYPFDPALPIWKIAGSGALIAVATGAALVVRRSRPYPAVGWGWFLVSLVPVIGLVQIGFQSTADRYTYLPSIGLLLIVAGAIHSLESTPSAAARAAPWVVASVALPLALLAHRQAATWRDGVTLFTHAIEVTGSNYVAERHLANALRDAGRDDEATELRVRQLAVAALPGERDKEALELLDRGRSEPARRILEVEAEKNPGNWEALCHLGIALAMQGKIDEAAARFEEAARVKADFAPAYYNLGLARERQGRDDDAISAYTRAVDLEPQNADGLFNLARVLARRGRFDEADERLTSLLRWKPDYPGAADSLGAIRRRPRRAPRRSRSESRRPCRGGRAWTSCAAGAFRPS